MIFCRINPNIFKLCSLHTECTVINDVFICCDVKNLGGSSRGGKWNCRVEFKFHLRFHSVHDATIGEQQGRHGSLALVGNKSRRNILKS